MKLSNYPFPEGLRGVTQFADHKTSSLLDQGLVAKLPYAGLPLYTPIGSRVLGQIERFIEESFSTAGFQLVRLPEMISTGDLENGDEIGAQFASKFMHLKSPQEGFHLLTTPEMTLIRTLGPAFSHLQLPIQLSYTANFYRNANDLASFLTCRQFRIFGALGFEHDTAGALRSMAHVEQLLNSIFLAFGIPMYTQRNEDNSFEMFYPTAEGDYPGSRLEGVSGVYDKKLLSLGMAFQYGADVRLPIRMRTPDNRNAPIHVWTFGLCTNRVLFAAFDAGRESDKFGLPKVIRPFDIAIVPVGREHVDQAQRLCLQLEAQGLRVVLDDRHKVSQIKRIGFAKTLGVPVQVSLSNAGAQIHTFDGKLLQSNCFETLLDAIIEGATS